MVGHVMAIDLSSEYEVTAVDINNDNLKQIQGSNVKIVQGNIFKNDFLDSLILTTDWFVLAIPGFLGYEGLKRLVARGQKVVDISFFPEDPFELSQIAKENGGFALVDCGIAPGYSHLAAGNYYEQGLKEFYCYVGGLPFEKNAPFNYKAPFSPIDVIEEYTREARYKEDGQIIIEQPLLLKETIEFEQVENLEAFISDGIRSLLYTLPEVNSMYEKTLRYPGHADLMLQLKQAGYFDESEIEISGTLVSPLKLSEKLLFDHWKLSPNDDEFTIMRMILKGDFGLKKIDIFDRRDQKSGFSSMSRTTGFTATSSLRFLIQNKINQKGIFTPEQIATKHKIFDFVTDLLIQKGIEIKIS